MHNGQIGGYLALRQRLDGRIPADLYRHREGSTDTEALFYLALANGLAADPLAAMNATIAEVEAMMSENGTAEAFRMSVAASDGVRIIAYRYSSDRASPSLFYIRGEPLSERIGVDSGDAVLVLSEPLDEDTEDWTEVPDAHMLVARGGEITLTPLSP